MNERNIMEIISIIKDIVNILFLILTGILGILTYLKARKTILQPLKSETAKKQFELLSSMYDEFNKAPCMEMVFGYQNIVFLNTFHLLDEYALITPKEELKNILEHECIAGTIFTSKDGCVKTLEEVAIFENEEKNTKVTPEQRKKKLRQEALDGNIYFEIIYYPKKTYELISKINSYSHSPFIPKKIAIQLDILEQEFHKNLKIMKDVIEVFAKSFAERVKNKANLKFDIDGIYNDFHSKATSHQKTIDNLLNEIRKHLYIDDNWL